MKEYYNCPHCKTELSRYKNPSPTTDVIIYDENRGIVLIERCNEPLGYALPGGFIDYGESAETAAIREMHEETSLHVSLQGLLGVYSHPKRDERFHTMSIVFIGTANNPNELRAGDDAKNAAFFELNKLPQLAFDHGKIIDDFKQFLLGNRKLIPIDINNIS